MPTALTDIEWAATPLGMIVRGGFHPTPADAVPGAEPGEATLVLIGSAATRCVPRPDRPAFVYTPRRAP